MDAHKWILPEKLPSFCVNRFTLVQTCFWMIHNNTDIDMHVHTDAHSLSLK